MTAKISKESYEGFVEVSTHRRWVYLLGGVHIVFFLWLMSLPDSPQTSNPEFRIHSAAVSPCPLIPTRNPAADCEYLSATWDFMVSVINPDPNFDMFFESLQAHLFYSGKDEKEKLRLAMTPLPYFYITKMNQSSLNFTLAMAMAYVGDDMIKELMSSESGCFGSARLGLNLICRFRYNTTDSFLKTRSFVTRNFCELSLPNNATDQSRACQEYYPPSVRYSFC